MTYTQIALACLVSGALAATGTYYFIPQIKTVEVTRDVVHTDIQTVTHTMTLPNGNIDTTTTTIDHTKRLEVDSKTTTQSIPKNWLVSGSYATDRTLEPIYGLQVQRRVLGNLFIGASGNTKGVIGLSIGMEF